VTLRLYLDEDVETLLGELLFLRGIDTVTTLQAGRAHQRISDEDQLAYAASVGRAICSHNVKDFASLAVAWAKDGREHAGIVLMQRRTLKDLVSRFQLLASRYPDGMANICDWL
jgi:hypothetical protein